MPKHLKMRKMSGGATALAILQELFFCLNRTELEDMTTLELNLLKDLVTNPRDIPTKGI